MDIARLHEISDFFEYLRLQLDIYCVWIFFQTLNTSRPRNGNNLNINEASRRSNTSFPWARTQAKASWEVVHPSLSAISVNLLTKFKFFWKFSSEKRGKWIRESSSSKSARDLICPVKKPRPRGEYATIPMPSSRHVFRRSIWGLSMSSAHGEYSTWIAATNGQIMPDRTDTWMNFVGATETLCTDLR